MHGSPFRVSCHHFKVRVETPQLPLSGPPFNFPFQQKSVSCCFCSPQTPERRSSSLRPPHRLPALVFPQLSPRPITAGAVFLKPPFPLVQNRHCSGVQLQLINLAFQVLNQQVSCTYLMLYFYCLPHINQ